MSTESDHPSQNPFESPRPSRETAIVGRRASLARGVLWAIPLGTLGFVVPYVVLGVPIAVQLLLPGYSEFDGYYDVRRWLSESVYAAVGCAIVFTMAAMIQFAPAKRMGLLRAIIVAGVVTLGAMSISGFLTHVFGIDQRTYEDPHFFARCALGVSVVVGSNIGAACVVIYIQGRKRETP